MVQSMSPPAVVAVALSSAIGWKSALMPQVSVAKEIAGDIP